MIRFTAPGGADIWINPPFDSVAVMGGSGFVKTHIYTNGREDMIFVVTETVDEVIEKYKKAGYEVYE